MGLFVPQSSLPHLKEYEYQSEDHSLVSRYILKPYWQQFVKFFPLWMAPNMVTLLGFGFMVFSLCIVLLWNPSLEEDTPRWTYFTYAICLFLYQTFDACDGAHARRTGQSGPLGELFDHCIDSVNTTLSVFIYSSTIKCGYKFITVLIQFVLLTNFYLSTWEEYHTHKLYLSQFNGPVEGILVICAFYIATGILGPAVWHTKLIHFNLFGKEGIDGIDVANGISFLALIFNIDSAWRNVLNYYHEKYGTSPVGNKHIKSALYGLVPFFGFFASVFAVSVLEPSFISFPFILTNGLAMAFMVGRIIVAHLTKQEFPTKNAPLFIPSALLLLKYLVADILGHNSEKTIWALQWFGFGLAAGIHAMFVTEVIYEFTTYLDIYALTIKHRKKA
ncbi:HCL420Wp [Eremothecium sinecaudum]|uniref:diacylglycerol cholinephosphotransferase n=1 Tax=Eremothecium sinecaudum TaxID=45286 RepID=A0A109UWA0_9SACH|nr:HCL420Wp [Eremothecium sinecaudum]AMD19731.1 HCL420Wp [Eremothecium sinecaudum]